jgi:hypothetical protein
MFAVPLSHRMGEGSGVRARSGFGGRTGFPNLK